MDVMKVQKLNQMAVDLSKHHIVGSREDAVNRAAQIFGEENNFSKPSPSPELQTQQNDLSKDVRRLTFALNDVINHLNEVKIAHSKLEKEFNDFRVNQRRFEAPRQQTAQNAFVDAPHPEVRSQQGGAQQAYNNGGMSDAQARLLAAMEPAKTKSTRDPTKAIDRNNVAPNEVSIDKFFYSGRR